MSVLNRAAVIVWVLGLCGLFGLVGFTDAAFAQEGSGSAGAEAPPPPATSSRSGEMAVTITRVGAGGRARPGDWAAVQVEITNQTDRIREVLVRAVIPDPDGDRAGYERTIVSNPGAKQSVWLYVKLPFAIDSGTSITVTAHEAEEADSGSGVRYRAGRELGSGFLRLGNYVGATTGIMYVVGGSGALEQYMVTGKGFDYAATGHELTDVINLQIADIPDRAIGLLSSDTLVWTPSSQRLEPSDLSRDQAAAIREWVRRGGHLVVVLPGAGQAWLGRPDNPLSDLMPAASPVLFEAVDLEPMRRLLTNQPSVAFVNPVIVQTFRAEPDAGPYDAMPVLSVPADHPASGVAGQPIVIRRLVGQGAVTVVGIDVSLRSLTEFRRVEADIFWNRVLGRRIDLLKPDDLNDKLKSKAFFGNRQDKELDAGVGGEISMTAEAAAGLLLAFVVFGLYWLFAGPVGHFALKRRDLRRHSWLGFVGVAGIFTAIAWGGANLIKAKRVSGNHLTFIDHVYGQPSQRTRTWVNIHVPRYGDVRVSAATDEVGGGMSASSTGSEDWHVMIAPWDDPEGSSGWGGFPDRREYTVESRDPVELVVPFRSTSKQFRIDWAGPVRDGWGMPRPEAPPSAGGVTPELGKELVLKKESSGRGWSLSGSLTHDLPGDLTNVVVVVVPHQDRMDSKPELALVADARAVSYSTWERGKKIDLGAAFGAQSGPTDKNTPQATTWLHDVLGKPSGHANSLSGGPATQTEPNALLALTFYSMLEPPIVNAQNIDDTAFVARRRSTHTWDLGRWFTQPCVIVVGLLREGPSPTPLRVDGREVELHGKTLVRWVYPLTPDPPEYGPRTGSGTPTGPDAKPTGPEKPPTTPKPEPPG